MLADSTSDDVKAELLFDSDSTDVLASMRNIFSTTVDVVMIVKPVTSTSSNPVTLANAEINAAS